MFFSSRAETKKAAIGFTYEDSTPAETEEEKSKGWEEDDSDDSDSSISDIDLGKISEAVYTGFSSSILYLISIYPTTANNPVAPMTGEQLCPPPICLG